MSDLDIALVYKRVADAFATRIQQIFATEESLADCYAKYFEALPFDRTLRWNTILRLEFRDAWNDFGPEVPTPPTSYDRSKILWELYWKLGLDLFTQVYPNIQPHGNPVYRVTDVQDLLDKLRVSYEGKSPSPFDAKAKMLKTASTLVEAQYNRDLSTVKALKPVALATAAVSYRVSPIGSTPALTDDQNLSGLGVGADQFLDVPPGLTAYYITWEAPQFVLQEFDGKLYHQFIPHGFTSKSGGEILNSVLESRRIAYQVFGLLAQENKVVFLPRMGSVLFLTSADHLTMMSAFNAIANNCPYPLRLHKGVRDAEIQTVAASPS